MVARARSIVWSDASGNTRQTILRGDDSGGSPNLSDVQEALQDLSNADVSQVFEGDLSVLAPSPVLATYPAVADYAVLVYTDGSANLVYITLPAPVSSLFLADQETVDPSQLTDLNAQVIGVITTGAGNPVTAFVGGTRRKKTREYQ